MSATHVPAPRIAVTIRDMRPGDIRAAVTLLAGTHRDNPNPRAAFGEDPERRRRGMEKVFGGLFRVQRDQQPLVALDGERIVGVTGVAPPGRCHLNLGQQLRMTPGLLSTGPASVRRLTRWFGDWARLDPGAPHSHLGPLGVEADLRGHGIGSQILAEYCRRLDAHAESAYLETETEANVRLYRRFGFDVVAERQVIGQPNWFMWREARPT